MNASRLLSKISYIIHRLPFVLRPNQIFNSSVHKNSVIQGGSQFINSSIGAYSFIGYDCLVNNASIGKFCSIADNVVIGPAEHDLHMLSTSPCFFNYPDVIKHKFSLLPKPIPQKVIIENDVWIGINSSIKSGLLISNGSVVGMNSVVTRDVPPYAVVAGNPARVIKYRFDEDLVAQLLASEWWNLDNSLIETYATMYAANPKEFAKSVLNYLYYK